MIGSELSSATEQMQSKQSSNPIPGHRMSINRFDTKNVDADRLTSDELFMVNSIPIQKMN